MLRWNTVTLLFAGFAVGCVGAIGGPEQEDGGGYGNGAPTTQAFEPPAPTMRRLLARQYQNAIRDLLGESAAVAATPPADAALSGFASIAASQFNMGLPELRLYESSARAVAAAAMSDGKVLDLLTCTPTGAADAACMATFAKSFGRLAFRRSLTDEEVAGLVEVGELAAEKYETFDAAVEHIVATVLQSPSFLFQIEVGDPVEGKPELRRLSGRELATRMSFFLTDSTPTESLLDAAESGALDTPEGVRAKATELITSASTVAAVRAMYDESLGVADVTDPTRVTKDPVLFPQFTPELAASMREETLRLVADLYERDADFRTFLTADYTFIDENLAEFYGIDHQGTGFTKVSYASTEPRAGFLGHASFLASQAHSGSSSPTLRGKFLLERVLCVGVQPPPPDVNTVFPPNSGATKREQLSAHQAIPSCAGCHKLLDGIGLSFENFDAVGAFRATENGVTLDPSGEFEGEPFADPREFAQRAAATENFGACIVKNIFRHSIGHVETDGEESSLDALSKSFGENGFVMRKLLVELVASDAFRFVGAAQ